jgi:LmbE family N-acetylglucosaminyl deacetylase
MTQTKNVLAIFAHPDDEVICGPGTLALCAERGDRVSLLCATRGELGPIAHETLATRATLGEVRERELRQSCAALGIADVELLDLPDSGVAAAAYEHHTLHKLVHVIRRDRPAMLISFGADGIYGHPDHVAMCELASEARRAAADPKFQLQEPQNARDLQPYHIPRHFFPVWTGRYVRQLLAALSAAGTPGQLWALEPEQFPALESVITAEVDVTSVLSKKIKAIHCHRTQLARDNALALLEGKLAERFLGREFFHCADKLGGTPLEH